MYGESGGRAGEGGALQKSAKEGPLGRGSHGHFGEEAAELGGGSKPRAGGGRVRGKQATSASHFDDVGHKASLDPVSLAAEVYKE